MTGKTGGTAAAALGSFWRAVALAGVILLGVTAPAWGETACYDKVVGKDAAGNTRITLTPLSPDDDPLQQLQENCEERLEQLQENCEDGLERQEESESQGSRQAECDDRLARQQAALLENYNQQCGTYLQQEKQRCSQQAQQLAAEKAKLVSLARESAADFQECTTQMASPQGLLSELR